ncbi:MAG: glycosyltransferase family 2 protein [Pirellulales bacterium]
MKHSILATNRSTTNSVDNVTKESAESVPNSEIVDRLLQAEQAIRDCLDTCDPSPPIGQTPSVESLELTVVMPCLNEADTLGICIEKAQRAMRDHNIRGEVVIADNGSTDQSREIAAKLGARVVVVQEKGYGSALMGGIQAARGSLIIMGDADDSYDFLEIPKFVDKLRQGHELVQGCRLPCGGGRILPGAMPKLHRWWGNPMFSWMVRRMFRTPIHDVYCGLRGFTRQLYDRLDLRCTGMEFATEMIIKSSLFGIDTVEVSTTLHPDGRKAHAPHLRTFRDGWRTLRFFFMYSPRWLFLMPGTGLFLLGVLGYALALPGVTLAGATLDAHTLLIASLVILLGYQLIQFAIFAKTFAISEKMIPEDQKLTNWMRVMNLERCLLAGLSACLGGGSLITIAFYQWQQVGFGPLDYSSTMRWVIPGVTMAALGFQTIFSSFFISILRMARR